MPARRGVPAAPTNSRFKFISLLFFSLTLDIIILFFCRPNFLPLVVQLPTTWHNAVRTRARGSSRSVTKGGAVAVYQECTQWPRGVAAAEETRESGPTDDGVGPSPVGRRCRERAFLFSGRHCRPRTMRARNVRTSRELLSRRRCRSAGFRRGSQMPPVAATGRERRAERCARHDNALFFCGGVPAHCFRAVPIFVSYLKYSLRFAPKFDRNRCYDR